MKNQDMQKILMQPGVQEGQDKPQARNGQSDKASQDNKNNREKKGKQEDILDKQQKRLIKKRRAGVELSEQKVQEIKAGRKKLRKMMRQQGIRSRKEFELTASSMGLYFDKHRFGGLLLWLFHGKALWALLGATALLLLALYLTSLVSQMRGHFTINLGDDMFKMGFVLSDTADFVSPRVQLFSDPLVGVPCISITSIPEDVGEQEGSHNGEAYFAYTFFLRNESDIPVDYNYILNVTSESQNLSCATWIMLYQEDEMVFYAEGKEDGSAEAVPALEDNSRGYPYAPFYEVAADKSQYSEIPNTSGKTYYRLHPQAFASDTVVTSGRREQIEPFEVHKYTVVIWLEGDDADCTDDLIGGHLGLEMNFALVEGQDDGQPKTFWESVEEFWSDLYSNMKFWAD